MICEVNSVMDRLRSKQFKLYAGQGEGWGFLSEIQMKVAKLFVGDAQNANFAELGKKWFNPIYVDFGIGRTGAVTDVDGELEHGESIIYQGLPKTGGSFSVGFGFSG